MTLPGPVMGSKPLPRYATRLASFLAVLCTATALSGCEQPAPTAAPRMPEVLVRVVEPQPVPLRTELPGRTAPFMVAEVRPQVGGIIRARPFTEGAAVRAGDVLYEIEPASFQAVVDQQEALLARARASVTATRAQVESYRKLLPANAISRQEYDNAKAAHEQALADVGVQTAALNTARINLRHTLVTAPIDGRTSRSAVTPGALVSAAQATPLLTISQLDPILVDIAQSSTELMELRQAVSAGRINRDGRVQSVTLVLDDGTTYAHEGRIELTEVTVDPSSSSVTLRARFPNPDGLLLPGMYVRAQVDEGLTPAGILVPQSAVTRDRRGNPTVRIADRDNRLQVHPVTIPRSVGTDWLVTEGLAKGDRVVLEGAREAPVGTEVRAMTASPAAPATPGSPATEEAPLTRHDRVTSSGPRA